MQFNEIKNVHDIFTFLDLPCNHDVSGDFVEDTVIAITDSGYINYINDESILLDSTDVHEEYFNFGEILIEYSNLIKDEKKIISIMDNLKMKYSIPTLDYIKDFYYSFRNIGYSDLVSRNILFGALYNLCSNKKIIEFNYNEYFAFLVLFLNPITNTKRSHYTLEASARVSFWEDTTKQIQMCYTDLNNDFLCTIDTIYARNNNITIKKCNHCNGYYLQINKNNKKYCPNCKLIQSDKKADGFQKAYRKKYKTMMQRQIRYGYNNDEYEYYENYTKKWIAEAKKQIIIYRNNNDIKGFENYLNSAAEKYKPNNKEKYY